MFGLENLFRQVLEITEDGEGEEEEGDVGAVMLLDAGVDAGGGVEAVRGPPVAAPVQPPMPPRVAPPPNVLGMPVAVNAPAARREQWRAEEAGDDLLDNLLAGNVLAGIIATPYVFSV
jgi:hypothetical protein